MNQIEQDIKDWQEAHRKAMRPVLICLGVIILVASLCIVAMAQSSDGVVVKDRAAVASARPHLTKSGQNPAWNTDLIRHDFVTATPSPKCKQLGEGTCINRLADSFSEYAHGHPSSYGSLADRDDARAYFHRNWVEETTCTQCAKPLHALAETEADAWNRWSGRDKCAISWFDGKSAASYNFRCLADIPAAFPGPSEVTFFICQRDTMINTGGIAVSLLVFKIGRAVPMVLKGGAIEGANCTFHYVFEKLINWHD